MLSQLLLPWSDLATFVMAFAYNLVIAVCAMLLGCVVALGLGYGAAIASHSVYKSMKLIRSLFCNVPSFVLLFYFTLIVPSRIELLGDVWSVSPLIKATLALAIPVIGYFSELFERMMTEHFRIPLSTIKQFFIVILMASTTASVIGVEEIMATANTYIAVRGDTEVMLKVYLTVATVFVISGVLIQALFYALGLLHRALALRYGLKKKEDKDEVNIISPSA